MFENVSEELPHALFIATVFEIHRCHKRLRLRISVRTFEKHPKIVNRADIVFADVNDKAWICLLLNGDLSAFFFGSDFNAWLGYLNLLFVQVRSNFDGRMALYKVDCICNRILDVLVEVVHFLSRCVFVDNDFSAIDDSLLDGATVAHSRLAQVVLGHLGLHEQDLVVGGSPPREPTRCCFYHN